MLETLSDCQTKYDDLKYQLKPGIIITKQKGFIIHIFCTEKFIYL